VAEELWFSFFGHMVDPSLEPVFRFCGLSSVPLKKSGVVTGFCSFMGSCLLLKVDVQKVQTYCTPEALFLWGGSSQSSVRNLDVRYGTEDSPLASPSQESLGYLWLFTLF
jgi:hypothetical protein